MSKKTPDDQIEFQIFQQGNCRFSYTLNNDQPVRCSIIGNTPLFFMDCDEAFDEDFDEFFSLEEIEKNLEALEDRVSRAAFAKEDAAEEDPFYTTGAKALLLLEDKAFITEPAKDSAAAAPDIAFFQNRLKKSRLADEFLSFLKTYNVNLAYSRQVENASYDRSSGQILINPERTDAAQLLLAAREIRTAWQHKNGALLHPLTFYPDQAILVNRAQIADAMSCMVRIAWELQLAGEKEAWEYLERSSMADLAHAFARESYLDFRTLNNGTANSAVFENWFLSERCQIEDKRLIQLMLADYGGYVFDHEQASRQITADLIAALGSMPFGKNYLAPYVQTVMTDPVFTEIRDRSNANFLWFIKFERSFRETERELQKEGDINDHELSCDQFHKNKERFDDNEEKQNIVFLPQERQADSLSTGNRKAAGGKVVYLQHRPDE